jgi:WhiB family redox-sensing transcriptional regulator
MRDYFDWRKDPERACADSELFWNPDGNSKLQNFEARRICQTCPVKMECLRHAIVYDEAEIWGGTTDRDRREMVERNPNLRAQMIGFERQAGIFHPDLFRTQIP